VSPDTVDEAFASWRVACARGDGIFDAHDLDRVTASER
jgi:hypothetical protein